MDVVTKLFLGIILEVVTIAVCLIKSYKHAY